VDNDEIILFMFPKNISGLIRANQFINIILTKGRTIEVEEKEAGKKKINSPRHVG
jgi:hypothetical protein